MTTLADLAPGIADRVQAGLAPELRAHPWVTPGQMAQALDRTTIQTPALDAIDQRLVDVADGDTERLAISIAPQEGKSSRVSVWFPVWLLHRNPNLRIAIVSAGLGLARKFGGQIRDTLRANPQLGLTLSQDTKAKHEFNLLGYRGGVYCVGIDGMLTGRPVDCISGDMLVGCEHGQIPAAEAFTRGITRIRAYDHATGRVVWRPVEAARRIRGRRVVTVTTTSGRTLTCTTDHRVYTSRGYVSAGSLRPGETLVGVMAADRVPMRQSPGGAEGRRQEGNPPGTDALLLNHLHSSRARRTEPDTVLRLRRVGATEPPVNMLRRVPQSPTATTRTSLPAVRRLVSAPHDVFRLLLERVRGHRALGADDRGWQQPLQGRQELREVVQVHASADLGSRPVPVCGVHAVAEGRVHQEREGDLEVGAGGASHRPRHPEQPTGEPDHALRGLPHRSPRSSAGVEPDTVALAVDGGDQTVDVYDFQVAGTRNFFASGLLVHNCLIIDDPYADAKDADSEAWRTTVRSFWTDVALTRLPPKAPAVLVQTRWRQDDLTGWLLDEGEAWQQLNIPAQADHDPGKGETDPLGRAPGEFMESTRGRTPADWLQKRREVGSRTWNALYQGRPSPVEGNIFHRDWWNFYDVPPWIVRADGSHWVVGLDEMQLHWDMTFKDTQGTDFVCGGVWMRRGVDAYLLDVVWARMDIIATLRTFRGQAAKWPQATLKVVEDKANGPAVIALLQRKVNGIVPEEPTGSKVARAVAVSPLVEAGNVWLPSPELAPWVGDYVEQLAGFPNASHDDAVDMTSQALNRLVLQPLSAGGELVQLEEYDMIDARGFYASPV